MPTDKDERIGATAASSDVNGPLSLSLSPKCSSRGYRIHGCTAGQSTHGCLSRNKKLKRDDPGRESISLHTFSAHTDSEKPFNHSTKEIPKEEKIPRNVYIQENATVTGTHAQTQGVL